MDIRERLQSAIELAVKRHSGLKEKAFIKDASEAWTIRENIAHEYYSSTEAMLVGTLLETYHRLHGEPDINYDFKKNSKSPSQSIWSGASAAVDLIDRLDTPQKQIIKTLL